MNQLAESIQDPETGKLKKADLLCHRCSTTFSFEVGIKSRKEERGNVFNVTEHGIECPTCANWTHAYWMSIPLENQRKELTRARQRATRSNRTQADTIRFGDLRKKYQKAYEKFQKDMYRETNTKPTMMREHVVE